MISIWNLPADHRLRIFADQALPYAIILFDPQGNIVEWPGGAEHLMGWTAKETVGKSGALIFTPEDRAIGAPEQELETARRTGQANDIRWHMRKDGSRFFVDGMMCALHAPDGSVIGFGKVLHDITPRKQLADFTERQASLLDLSYDPALSWEFETDRILYWNKSAEKMYGFTPLEAEGESPHQLLRTQFPESIEAIKESLRQTGRWQGELIHTPKNGMPIHVESRMVLRTDLAEYPIVLESNRDVTQQRRVTSELQAGEARFRSLVNASSQIVWRANASGEIVNDSPSWRAFTGQTYDELKGYGWLNALHPDDREPVCALWQRCVEASNVFETEYRVNRGNDEYRWTWVRGVPVMNDDGSVREWIGMNTDITERKRIDDTLRQTAADLATANRRQAEFLATLAHELRNPLAPIRTGLDLLRISADDPATIDKVRPMMERQVNHLVHLVNDLMDLARINSGKIELKKTRALLRDIVLRAVETSLPAIQARHHDFSVDMPEEPVWLEADPHRLGQVIDNLLTNAAKYTPEHGKIVLTVRREGDEAVIVVTDNGIGIPEESQPQIFDMFTQVGHGLEHSQGGLGIGLNLVKRLVGKHGGSVSVSSAGAGQGSTFIVRLPVERHDEAAVPSRPPDIPRDNASGCLRILIADDNRDAANLLAQLLEIEGHRVEIAGDGLQARDMALRFMPDLALLDIGMPGMNGYELARTLRRIPELQDTVLAALTGWGTQEDCVRARDAGFDHHLTKPVDVAELNALIARIQAAGQKD